MTVTINTVDPSAPLRAASTAQKTRAEACTMVYGDECHLAPASHSFGDDENVSYANELLINLSLGKLNSYARKETLRRNVLLQNILNERMQERDDGLQCFGQVRMHEVRLMVDRQQKYDPESARTWEDGAAMHVDDYMHRQELAEDSHDDDDNNNGDVEYDQGSTDLALQQERCELDETCGYEDCESSTDDDDMNTDDGPQGARVEHQVAPVSAPVSKSNGERAPFRIKLVLGKTSDQLQARGDCADSKHKRDLKSCTDGDVAPADTRCCKRQRLNSTGTNRNQSTWAASRRLSSVF